MYLVSWGSGWPEMSARRWVLGGDVFFGVYLALAAFVTRTMTTDDLRHHARYEDEGIWFILVLMGFAIAFSLSSIFGLLARDRGALTILLVALSVVLGWLTLHTVMAFRYAHLFYKRSKQADGSQRDAAVLEFPGTDEPQMWDFFYFALVVGMTAQVSDVQTFSTRIRRVTVLHGVTSFFFNTVIVALAVNIAVNGP